MFEEKIKAKTIALTFRRDKENLRVKIVRGRPRPAAPSYLLKEKGDEFYL
jgi:hypothetical protein